MAIITEQIGDIFSTPPNSILIHACNARGAWGSGVAASFKQKHPHAFRKYHTHCLSPAPGSKLPTKQQHQANIVGTTLLIPPPPKAGDVERYPSKTPHYIACLFTSLDYGKRVAPAEEILKNTESALKDLARQIAEMGQAGEEVGKCYAVRINSGKFGVEWERTKAVMEDGEVDVTVVRPVEEEKAETAGAAVGEKVGQPFVTGGGAKGHMFSKATGARAESLDGQMIGEKRKRKADMLEGDYSDRENAKGKEPTRYTRALQSGGRS